MSALIATALIATSLIVISSLRSSRNQTVTALLATDLIVVARGFSFCVRSDYDCSDG